MLYHTFHMTVNKFPAVLKIIPEAAYVYPEFLQNIITKKFQSSADIFRLQQLYPYSLLENNRRNMFVLNFPSATQAESENAAKES